MDIYFENVAVFHDGSGYLPCRGNNTVYLWDKESWQQLDNWVFPDDNNGWVDCLRFGRCVFWGGYTVSILHGQQFEATEPLSGAAGSRHAVSYQNEKTAYILAINYEDPEFDSLFLLEELTWKSDERFEPNLFSDPKLVRISDRYAAFSYRSGPNGGKTLILDGKDNLIETDWPYFRWMAFAPGGSGIGIDDKESRVYLIEGMDLTEVYNYDKDVERPSGFLIAADAPDE